MATVVYATPLLGRLNQRLFPVTQDQFGSVLAQSSVVTSSQLTTILSHYPTFSVGTWTPTISAFVEGDLSVTYSSQVGTWERIHDIVFLNCDVVTSAFTYTTSTGEIRIGTMPFTSNEQYNAQVSYSGINKTGGYAVINAATFTSGNFFDFETPAMGKSVSVVNITDMPSGGLVIMRFTMWYRTDDP